MENLKENNGDFVPSPPDYKGDGIAIWIAVDKNGNKYFKVSVLGGKIVNCFKYESKKTTNIKGTPIAS